MIEVNGKKYYPTIGLEVHAELATETKMFCACKNNPDEESPNVNTCPVCMAHPGTLPVPNKKAIESVVKVGLAINEGTKNIANFSEFDRKNYFYPDIPKGYQISQYKYPIVAGGNLAGVEITRIHLEEDTANSKHDRGNFSLVDFNRAGVPLMELVTEPVIHDSETAMKFAKELQLLLRTLGVAHANMEKGEMRVEVNVSVSPDPDKFATKVEVKNIASFSAAGKAIDYEIKRMIGLYEAGKGEEIVQETRGWDDNKQSTYSQRKKESSHDYRYFPDPDIPKFYLHEMFPGIKDGSLRGALPLLPEEKRAQYRSLSVKDEDVETLVATPHLEKMFNEVKTFFNLTEEKEKIKIAASLVVNELNFELEKNNIDTLEKKTLSYIAGLVDSFTDKKISSRVVKDDLAKVINNQTLVEDQFYIITNSRDSSKVVRKSLESKGLLQNNDEGALKTLAQKYINANPNVVAEYKAGKEPALMFFVGQIMKETKGSANPGLVQKILKDLLQ